MLRVVKNEEELLSSPFGEVTITAEEYSLLKLLLGVAIQDLEDEDIELLPELRCMMVLMLSARPPAPSLFYLPKLKETPALRKKGVPGVKWISETGFSSPANLDAVSNCASFQLLFNKFSPLNLNSRLLWV